MLKIWSDKRFLAPGQFCHMLMPFWGQREDPADPDATRFDRYIAQAHEMFEMVSLAQADFAVFPGSPRANAEAFREFQRVTGDRRIIAFYNDDDDSRLEYREGVYVFRTSFYAGSRRPNEFALPGWSADFGKMPPRFWRDKPVVGFCGSANQPNRKAGLDALEASPLVETLFIRDPQFWGGWVHHRARDPEGWRPIRQRFLNNMLGSDYVFCCRGGGNFSYRIFETLCCGRIPVLLDTDCVLPCGFALPWKEQLIPCVSWPQVDQLAETIMAFHHRLGPDEFWLHQERMRKNWEHYLSPEGFFRNLHLHFEERQ